MFCTPTMKENTPVGPPGTVGLGAGRVGGAVGGAVGVGAVGGAVGVGAVGGADDDADDDDGDTSHKEKVSLQEVIVLGQS